MSRHAYFMRYFICTECGNKQVAPKSRATGKGHIKTMYCWKRKGKTDFKQTDIERLRYR